MSQPVKLSDELVLDARLTAETAERSIAGQIENSLDFLATRMPDLPPRHRSGHLHAVLAALGRPALGKSAALHSPVEAILSRDCEKAHQCMSEHIARASASYKSVTMHRRTNE